MKIAEFVASASRFLLSLLLALAFAASVVWAGVVSYQSEQTVRETRQTQSGEELTIRTIKEIPEPTEPCAPEEAEWWNRVRKAGLDLQRKNNEKSRTGFYLLLYEGQQKSYRIPLKDRPPQTLFGASPAFNRDRKQRTRGTVELSVDYRADGSVADVQVIKGVRSDIDASAIHATSQIIFLPAIKNGAFVTERGKIEYKFYTAY
jgi:TonB family protein